MKKIISGASVNDIQAAFRRLNQALLSHGISGQTTVRILDEATRAVSVGNIILNQCYTLQDQLAHVSLQLQSSRAENDSLNGQVNFLLSFLLPEG
jgi:hypothetical protein